ncbi:MAG TPA: HAD family acid phosphatase [Gemmatimonadaceae bacterium]|nr:HAD family acid phosphatase [Gemmatimonadaceae bacterium]
MRARAAVAVRGWSRARIAGVASVVVMFAGCAKGPAPAVPVPAPVPDAAADSIPLSVRWFRASAERRALYLQGYRTATTVIERRSPGFPAGSWAVILDADETVIDNSPYQQELAERRASYDEASWREWVQREAAAALPGAAAFTARVRALGGKVVIVTNRDDRDCEPTRANLEKAGIVADEVLCRTDPKNGSKDPRFEAVAAGTTPSTLPALKVLMWVGDNIQDFPRLSQAIRTAGDAAFANFGETYIVLPNPMYGSWERNALP